jgi:hypothetical protein
MDNKHLSGVIGFFEDPQVLLEAARKIREQNYEFWDTYTPYPVHGLEHAQGLKRSVLPFITFAAGLTGATLGFVLQYWTSAIDWPIIVGGKPFNSWPAFVPVMFECTILFAGLATAGAMILFNGLPNVKRRIFDTAITRDKFAIVIERPLVEDEQEDDHRTQHFKDFAESEAAQLLRTAGAKDVRSVYNEGWF